jgi:hypothetical protein
MLIPPKVLKGISRAANHEPGRYALQGVLLEREPEDLGEPNKLRATATDGKVLASARWIEELPEDYPDIGVGPLEVEGFSAVVWADDCKTMAGLPPKRSSKPILCNVALSESPKDEEGEVLFAGATDLDTKKHFEVRKLCDRESYPDYRKAIDTLSKGSPTKVKFDLRRLERAVQVLKETIGVKKRDPDSDAIVEVEVYEGAPTHLTMRRDDLEVKVLLMPLVEEKKL